MPNRGRRRKYEGQPKNRPLFAKLTDDGYHQLHKRAIEYRLSKSELIEQFARTPWLSPPEVEEVRHLLELLRDRLVAEMGCESPISSESLAKYHELEKLVRLLGQLSVTN